MIVLDTNIIIAFLKGDATISAWFASQRIRGSDMLGISIITVTELLSFPDATDEDLHYIQRWLKSSVWILPIDERIAIHAGELCRKFRLKTADAIIAATTKHNRAALLKRDKDFKKVKDLSFVSL
ncbi:MAG: type II toxin-antitoxin system VapC family toxin [Patescibacteria group bacterium]